MKRLDVLLSISLFGVIIFSIIYFVNKFYLVEEVVIPVPQNDLITERIKKESESNGEIFITDEEYERMRNESKSNI